MLDHLRERFVRTYDLDVAPGSVTATEPLFGPDSRFELDSMDALKLIAELHGEYAFDLGTLATDSFRTLDSIIGTVGARADRTS